MIAYTGIETISNMAEEAKDEAAHDPGRDQARGARGVRDLRGAAGGRAVGAAGALRRGTLPDAAGRERGQGRVRRRPGAGDRQAPAPRARCSTPARSTSGCSPRRSCSSPPTPGSSGSRGWSTRWGCTARCPTSCASCIRASARPWIGIIVLRRDRLRHADPGPGRLPGQHVRVRRDAVVHDRARVGDPVAPDRRPTASAPTAARARSGSPGASCRCSRSSAASARSSRS